MRTSSTAIAVRFSAFLASYLAASIPGARANEIDQALSQITNTADKICGIVAASGQADSTKVKGAVNAELGGLSRSLADLGINGSGEISSKSYNGVIQNQLADILKRNMDCKYNVFMQLRNIVFHDAPPQDGEPPPPPPGSIPKAADLPNDMFKEGRYENGYFSVEETRTSYYDQIVFVDYKLHTKRDFKMMSPYQWWFSGKDDKRNEYRDATGSPFAARCTLQSNNCKEDQFVSYKASSDIRLVGGLGITDIRRWRSNKPQFIYALFNFMIRDGAENKIIQVPIKSEMDQSGGPGTSPAGCGISWDYNAGIERLNCQ